MNNICCQISKNSLDFIGFENATFFNRKQKIVTFYVFRLQKCVFSERKNSANLLEI